MKRFIAIFIILLTGLSGCSLFSNLSVSVDTYCTWFSCAYMADDSKEAVQIGIENGEIIDAKEYDFVKVWRTDNNKNISVSVTNGNDTINIESDDGYIYLDMKEYK